MLSVYINQQLYGRACWCWMWVCVLVPLWNFTKMSLTVDIKKRSFVSYYKFRSRKLQCWDLN